MIDLNYEKKKIKKSLYVANIELATYCSLKKDVQFFFHSPKGDGGMQRVNKLK